jgi:hypothetical protein
MDNLSWTLIVILMFIAVVVNERYVHLLRLSRKAKHKLEGWLIITGATLLVFFFGYATHGYLYGVTQ